MYHQLIVRKLKFTISKLFQLKVTFDQSLFSQLDIGVGNFDWNVICARNLANNNFFESKHQLKPQLSSFERETYLRE